MQKHWKLFIFLSKFAGIHLLIGFLQHHLQSLMVSVVAKMLQGLTQWVQVVILCSNYQQKIKASLISQDNYYDQCVSYIFFADLGFFRSTIMAVKQDRIFFSSQLYHSCVLSFPVSKEVLIAISNPPKAQKGLQISPGFPIEVNYSLLPLHCFGLCSKLKAQTPCL